MAANPVMQQQRPITRAPPMCQAPAKKKTLASEVRRFFDPRAFVPERINAQISKRYSINAREVGSGGFGKVFVAEDKEVPGRKVAIKKICLDSKDMRASFEKEVALMKELDHPNICKILETYENGRVVWVVMEFCEGGEVFDRIMDRGRIEERLAAHIAHQVAKALKYAHSRGIAHRDLKPENVCFCHAEQATGAVKVIDWGVGSYFNAKGCEALDARSRPSSLGSLGQHLQRMCSAVGSTTYAAPEVLQAGQANGTCGYTSACDLWSLGVLTYVMLCGKPPFWGIVSDQLKRMQREHYPMHDETWQAVSKEAKDFIAKLLKCDPQDRLTLDGVLAHPWICGDSRAAASDGRADGAMVEQVLSNCRQFGRGGHFYSICAASVARQLDHRSLQDVQKVFTEMDTNGDGVLELREVIMGFERMFGKGSEQARGVEELFNKLDLDGSGQIDYTEFCAAGLGVGARMTGPEALNELSLRAAFKAFDINDDNGRITRDEIVRVLQGADVGKAWSQEVCEQVTEEIFERYDSDRDGSIDFEEWRRIIMDSWDRHAEPPRVPDAGHSADDDNQDILDSAGEARWRRTATSPEQPRASRAAGAEGYARSGSHGLTLLERRPLRNRLNQLAGKDAREPREQRENGSRKNWFSKVTDILPKKKGDRERKGSADDGRGRGGLATAAL